MRAEESTLDGRCCAMCPFLTESYVPPCLFCVFLYLRTTRPNTPVAAQAGGSRCGKWGLSLCPRPHALHAPSSLPVSQYTWFHSDVRGSASTTIGPPAATAPAITAPSTTASDHRYSGCLAQAFLSN